MKTEEGVTYEFPCYRWLASNEGDGELQRDLIPSLTFTDNETESGKVTEIIFSTACRQLLSHLGQFSALQLCQFLQLKSYIRDRITP